MSALPRFSYVEPARVGDITSRSLTSGSVQTVLQPEYRSHWGKLAADPAHAPKLVPEAPGSGQGPMLSADGDGPDQPSGALESVCADLADDQDVEAITEYSPTPAFLCELEERVGGTVPAQSAGPTRWRVEETFQAGKGLAGLDEHQLRRFTSWSRRVTLAMLAHAFLAVVRADEHTRHPAPDGLIPLTCNEIQRLFTMLVAHHVHDVAHRLSWSTWRRRHQAQARASHYRRQDANQT